MKRNEKGITLIALIITVIVLLILAGTAVSIAINGGDIFDRANEAKTAWNSAVATEEQKINEVWNILNTMTEDTTNGLIIPTGLTSGDTVTWTPSGTYEWNKEYYSDDDTVTKTLYSGAAATTADATTSTNWNDNTTAIDMTISSWKVLKVENGTVTIVPSAPTASGVKLRGAQGYNNAVKLLNDACDALYGGVAGSADGITAKSISMVDIEGLMDEAAISTAKGNKYLVQAASAYSASNSKYPVIYEEEAYSNINKGSGAVEVSTTNGLGMSDEATANLDSNGFIARTGKVTNATSIQPYYTYYYMNNSTFASALGYPASGYTETNGPLLPNGSSTRNYWVASRYIGEYAYYCNFYVRRVDSGNLDGFDVFHSTDNAFASTLGLFPIVTLSAGALSGSNGSYTYAPAS